MIQADAAIIGGTGIGVRLAEWGGRPFCVQTPFGSVRGRLLDREGVRLVLLQRHSPGHRLSPHQVPFAALGYALGEMRVDVCIASAAVGSLRTDWLPGTMAICSSFIDMTARQVTRYSSPPRHVDMQAALDGGKYLAQAGAMLGMDLHDGAVYVGMNGPRYESAAEIKMLVRAGGDLVGMTASSEAVALAENGVAYGCLGVVTNLGAGLSRGVLRHGEVTEVMADRGGEIVELLLQAALLGARDHQSASPIGSESG